MEVGFAGRMLAGLAVIVVVLYALQFVARTGWRSRLAGGDRRLMSVVETLALPNATSLHVVKIAERYYVVGRSASSVANLCEIPAEGIDAWIAAHGAPNAVELPLARLAARLGRPRV